MVALAIRVPADVKAKIDAYAKASSGPLARRVTA
jgi:predicted transcriptional regulator